MRLLKGLVPTWMRFDKVEIEKKKTKERTRKLKNIAANEKKKIFHEQVRETLDKYQPQKVEI
jgi:hypothetical protein